MSLHLHRAERSDRLVTALAELVTDPLPDPFAVEIVAVPTRGVERWLAQQLSDRLGVCAGVGFPSVRRLLTTALAPATGVDADTDPWHPSRSPWPILAILDQARDEEWTQLVWGHLRGRSATAVDTVPGTTTPTDPSGVSSRGGRRWLTARRIAMLFDRYALERPELLARWRSGESVDSAGQPLAEDWAWQAELWRRLRTELGVPGPAERLPDALHQIAADPSLLALPERLSVFGLTGLTRTQHRVLTAIAGQRDVHLWLTHPSPALWAAVAGQPRTTPRRRAVDRSSDLVGHRLLGYLGRDSRELQLVLTDSGSVGDQHHPLSSERAAPVTLLSQLQADIAANAPPRPLAERPLLDRHDRSLQVHAAHGQDRQVEVLRELLVSLLADDPTLEPRDIVVMCPDIEQFAPLISAAFGLADSATDGSPSAGSTHPGHWIRVRLADRALRRVNPLLSVLATVLDLAGSRLEASAVLDLAAQPPVARRFGFSSDDLDRLAQLVASSGVRWGLDAAHRGPYGLDHLGQNTWAAGLDRLLLGITMDEEGDHFIGTTLPLDEVDSSDVDLIGRAAELVGRLSIALTAFEGDHPIRRWLELAQQTIEQLTATSPADSWQSGQAQRLLNELAIGENAGSTVVSRAELQALLADTFGGRATRANFRTGSLTVCTMYPMRSVPHRVVCLLGMDDQVFPRRARSDGDDLLGDDPWVGDRDRSSEDRQLLLDAVMSATEHLVVLYSGADPRTGATRPPAVPINELLDSVDQTARTGDGTAVRTAICRRHPLQPFDQANFDPANHEIANGGAPFSFDTATLRGARAAAGERTGATEIYPHSVLPVADQGPEVELTDLVRFFSHPIKALLRHRGGLPTWEDDDTITDQLPVTVDGLDSWQIGDRLLTRLLRGADPDQLVGAEWRRGPQPPPAQGAPALDTILQRAIEVADRARRWLVAEPGSRDLAVEVGDRLLTGTVAPLHHTTLLSVSYSSLNARHRLAAFIQLLALTAAHPGPGWQAVTLGRRGTSVLGPLDPGWAALVLDDQLNLYATGLREPLPFAPRTSAEFARLRFRDLPVAPGRSSAERDWRWERDAAYERFFGAGVTLAEFASAPSRPEEERGTLAEKSRFGTLARRVFQPMLSVEELR
ncbi:MAG: exodeoxyribonuclease V subunit gamma [Microlunatus sp.]|nr:exodeoxyribonuclease V subunit gamma [Microlunatus sp.]